MPLNSLIRSYFLTSGDGRLISGNALSGARMSLHSGSEAIAYVNQVFQAFSALPKAPATIRDFEDCLNDARFSPFLAKSPRSVITSVMPLSHPNRPNLAERQCFTVLKLQYLNRLISQPDKDRMGIDFPLGGTPKDPVAFADALARLGASGRQFQLAPGEFLGNPLIWFTTETAAKRAMAACRRSRRGFADGFCDVLGLGHHKPGVWLVLLAIPGSAVEAAGHSRPNFADAGTHRWFMARTSKPAAPGARRRSSSWGQTADLQALATGLVSYNGGSERVSLQITSRHLGAARIGFELLGEVTGTSGSTTAGARLSDGVWGRRRG
jgi:hypothetical protein